MKTRKSVFAFNIKHKNLKNKLFLSCKNKNTLTPLNSSKTKISNDEKDKDNYINNNNIFNENFSFNLNFINESNNKIKTLAMINNGIIYWLRKLYIIFQNKSTNKIKLTHNKKLYFYFYYPIKDISMTKNKSFLYQFQQDIYNNNLICNNLNDIHRAVKAFLNINNIFEFLKINLYTENFNIIKYDNQLMEKIEKYKILYAKVIKLSEEHINNKKNRCLFHKHPLKSYDYEQKDNKLFYNIFKNKLIKNKLSLDLNLLNNKKNDTDNNAPKIETNKNQFNGYKIEKEITKIKSNKNSFNNVTNSIDNLILDDLNSIQTFYGNNNDNLKNLIFYNNTSTNYWQKNKLKKNKFNLKHKLSLDTLNYKIGNNRYLNQYNNSEIENINKINRNFRSYPNLRNDKINEINKKYYYIYNINNKNKINLNQYNNKSEMNQILFSALNTLIKNFISEKIDNYISNDEIKELFDIEKLQNKITYFEIDINFFLKEYLLYLYISNYINFYYMDFYSDFYQLFKDDYININTIFALNIFRDMIYNIKIVFDSLKRNKNEMKEKLKENYNKNEQNISFPVFIIFVLYNKKNLHTLYDKELLKDILNSIDIKFNLDIINNSINAEQYIKFRLFLTKNEIINDDMKKEFISDFYDIAIFNNDEFDNDKFIIKLNHTLINTDTIMKIVNKKNEKLNSNLDDAIVFETYNKFIEYLNY